jgi:hypothetical protein
MQVIVNAANKDIPFSGKFVFTKIVCVFYIISTQTIYIYYKFYEMNGFVKLRTVCLLFYTSCVLP